MEAYIIKSDGLGRVLLPKKVREDLGIEANSKVSLSLEGNKLIVKPLPKRCEVCGSEILHSK